MIRKLVVVGAILTGVVALVAGPAFAHIELEREGEVSAEGIVTASLSVPNEKPDSGTVKIALVFPETPALATAQPEPVDGWTATVEKNDAGDVTQVVWTGGPLTGEDRVNLPLEIGAVPDGVDTVDFTALQTYDNGDEVRWIEPTPPGGEEPDHPAPVLTVGGAAPEEHEEAAATTDDHSDDDGLSTGAIIAIVLAVIILLAFLGWVLSRTRRRMGSPTD